MIQWKRGWSQRDRVILLLAATGGASALLELSGIAPRVLRPVQILVLCVVGAYLSLRFATEANSTWAILRALLFLIAAQALVITVFAFLYMDHGLREGPVQIKSFSTSLYFSVITWTTVGYGDITPSESARFVAAGEALLGQAYMGVFLGVLLKWLLRDPRTTDDV